MNYAEAEKLLKSCAQEHVLAYWKKLSSKERAALLDQIAKIDAKDVKSCRAALKAGGDLFDSSKGKAPKVAVLKGKALKDAVAAGEKELKAGRVAALLVAGGQGSRLGYDGPKGCYSIGPITGAPLFYFHARKILARTIRYGAAIPFYVMTSEANNAATQRCFEENDFFGLNPKDVFFFQVDNPLVEIADPAFIGYHVAMKSEYSLKLCAKRDPYEKVGMPMKFGDRYRMIEYTEMTDEQCNRKDKAGKLYFLYGSPAIHVFDRAFLEREASKRMPLHLAFKKIPFVDAKGKVVKPAEPNGYKFEKFIFDILPNARRAAFLAFEQQEEFSPVKNAEGKDSPATCKADMMAKWRRWFAAAGVEVKNPALPIEIDPAYAVDAEDLKSIGLALGAE